MKYAFISDIHSNIEALEVVLDACDEAGVDEIFCLGDVIGYGADPNPCCDLIRERASVTLMGNHDAAVIGVMDTDYYYEAARDALYWTRQQLTRENHHWLFGLPYTHREANFGLYHSAPIKPSGFYYVVNESDASKHLPVFERLERFNFCGHSHLTTSFLMNGETVEELELGAPAVGRDGHKWLINVGSVGQPRDRDARACFGVLDTETDTFKHVRMTYDIDQTADKLLEAGLSEKFAKRLYSGM